MLPHRVLAAVGFGLLAIAGCSSPTRHVADGQTPSAARTIGSKPGSGALLALDSNTGRQLWRAPLPMASVSKPVVSGGLVLVAGTDDCDIHRVTVAAVRAESGQLAWQSSVAVPEPCTFASLLSLAGGVVVVGGPTTVMPDPRIASCDRTTPGPPAVALDVATGKQRWQAPVTTSVVLAATSTSVIMSGPTPDCVVGLDAKSGLARWTVKSKAQSVLAWSTSDTAYLERFVLNKGVLFGAIDPATGHTGWTVQMPATGRTFPPALGDAITIANSLDTTQYPTLTPGSPKPTPQDSTTVTLTSLAPSSGHELWHDSSQQDQSDSVTAAGDTLLVTRLQGERFVLELRDARTGARRWQSPVSNGFAASDNVTDGTVVVAMWNQTVAGLSAADGRQLWAVHGTLGPAAIAGTSIYLAANGQVKHPPSGD